MKTLDINYSNNFKDKHDKDILIKQYQDKKQTEKQRIEYTPLFSKHLFLQR